MYVRDAKNREEVWLLDHIEEFGLDDAAFRSRDYVVAIDESGGGKAGFGRIRIHKTEGGERSGGSRSSSDRRSDGGEFCELTSVGVLPEWRGQGVGAHVMERLIEHARDEGFETVFLFTPAAEYATQFGFEPVESSSLPDPMADRMDTVVAEEGEDTVALVVDVDEFVVPDRLRRRFKDAAPRGDDGDGDSEPEETAEDFGIDPDEATYKYDV
ncbi:acetyltransferase, N-acetylglutamate synthase [Salinarchaeum sp. Harcht-Bsk1]|uniref:GNAT family N-acetyltransferase n=1 Tax=Salinarchaeum sp. Harcht-Bsk1 TaxID=1333523 RepID=UPI0003422BAA|nr:GNAT family N-acetyltransferase [Salinarchaeum sp. Harcht-Bsk1]AGN01002.1 acetyltransferase, N-acetylglutamate synthase [Salinarchaeum sp. Harcht-Bsk1]